MKYSTKLLSALAISASLLSFSTVANAKLVQGGDLMNASAEVTIDRIVTIEMCTGLCVALANRPNRGALSITGVIDEPFANYFEGIDLYLNTRMTWRHCTEALQEFGCAVHRDRDTGKLFKCNNYRVSGFGTLTGNIVYGRCQ